jgi:rare lipoprotein A
MTKSLPFVALAFVLAFSISFPAKSATGDAQSEGKSEDRPASPAGSSSSDRESVKAPIDHSGRKQTGKASYYGKGFVNKETANGERMDPAKMTAASKTLPMGTRARITNTENGQSAEVTINDRGPAVKGRILDVTPVAADKLGMKSGGVVPVEVQPIAVPQKDGQIKQMGDTHIK